MTDVHVHAVVLKVLQVCQPRVRGAWHLVKAQRWYKLVKLLLMARFKWVCLPGCIELYWTIWNLCLDLTSCPAVHAPPPPLLPGWPPPFPPAVQGSFSCALGRRLLGTEMQAR